jgi:hypothetical protein
MNLVISHVLENAYCRGCPIYEGEERERRMKTLKVLFVGKSPPKDLMWEEEPYSYFYASGPESPKGLAYYMS